MAPPWQDEGRETRVPFQGEVDAQRHKAAGPSSMPIGGEGVPEQRLRGALAAAAYVGDAKQVRKAVWKHAAPACARPQASRRWLNLRIASNLKCSPCPASNVAARQARLQVRHRARAFRADAAARVRPRGHARPCSGCSPAAALRGRRCRAHSSRRVVATALCCASRRCVPFKATQRRGDDAPSFSHAHTGTAMAKAWRWCSCFWTVGRM